jgi:hypothetical protein
MRSAGGNSGCHLDMQFVHVSTLNVGLRRVEMKHSVITVNLYKEIDEFTGTLVDQCVALSQEMAVEYGEHHVELLEGKGWYEVKEETLH